MKSKLFILIALVCFSFTIAEAKVLKKSVAFNVIMQAESKDIVKNITDLPGVLNVKIDKKQSVAYIDYDGNATNIQTISSAFKSKGYIAFPIGENCSKKKGGCLNNAPTEINTMK